jgi:hypothetical protein
VARNHPTQHIGGGAVIGGKSVGLAVKHRGDLGPAATLCDDLRVDAGGEKLRGHEADAVIGMRRRSA